MASSSNYPELLASARCYECFGPLTTAQLLSLAIMRQYLLDANPDADTSPQSLIASIRCAMCLGMSFYDAIELAMMEQLSQL